MYEFKVQKNIIIKKLNLIFYKYDLMCGDIEQKLKLILKEFV